MFALQIFSNQLFKKAKRNMSSSPVPNKYYYDSEMQFETRLFPFQKELWEEWICGRRKTTRVFVDHNFWTIIEFLFNLLLIRCTTRWLSNNKNSKKINPKLVLKIVVKLCLGESSWAQTSAWCCWSSGKTA